MSTDFGSEPLDAAAALAKLRTLDPDEYHYDGNDTLTLKYDGNAAPEFDARTEVYVLNGIGNSMSDEIAFGATLANEVHGDVHLIHVATTGLPSDFETSVREKLDPGFARRQPPELAVERAVLAHITGTPAVPAVSGDVHFAAHSRGALVVERGLELVHDDLARAGYAEPQIRSLLAHTSVETYGGAASSLPAGVRALHYVNDKDPVALGFGMGPLTSGTAHAIGLIAAFNSGAAAAVAGYEIERALTLEPRGPVIVYPGQTRANPVEELIEAHQIATYLEHRTPFERTRAQALATQPDPAQTLQSAVVQRAVERLRAAGGPDLPDVKAAAPWSGATQSGTYLTLDATHGAQHVGRGKYVLLDVGRDLQGLAPPDGRPLTIDRQGGCASTGDLATGRV